MIPSKREIKKNNNNNVAKHAQNRFCCATRPRLDRHFPLGHSPPILDMAHIPLSPGGLHLLLHIMLPECCMHTLYQVYFIFVAAQSGRGKRPRCPKRGERNVRGEMCRGEISDTPRLQHWHGFYSNRSHLLDGSAHWRHLANTTKQSVCGGDAVLRQITLATSLLWRSCSTCSTRWHCSTSRCCSSMLSRSPGNRSRS